MAFTKLAAEIWRRYITDGEPTSGPWQPRKSQIVDWAEEVERLTQYVVPIGAIIAWNGAVASIPAGWVLCDGNNGTPDLRKRFIAGAEATGGDPDFQVGDTGGSATSSAVGVHVHGPGTLSTVANGEHTHALGTLTTSTAAAHTHGAGTLVNSSQGAHSHDVEYGTSPSNDTPTGTETFLEVGAGTTVVTEPAGAHNHTISGNTANGGAHSHGIQGFPATAPDHTHLLDGLSESVGDTGYSIRNPYYALAYIMKTDQG